MKAPVRIQLVATFFKSFAQNIIIIIIIIVLVIISISISISISIVIIIINHHHVSLSPLVADCAPTWVILLHRLRSCVILLRVGRSSLDHS